MLVMYNGPASTLYRVSQVLSEHGPRVLLTRLHVDNLKAVVAHNGVMDVVLVYEREPRIFLSSLRKHGLLDKVRLRQIKVEREWYDDIINPKLVEPHIQQLAREEGNAYKRLLRAEYWSVRNAMLAPKWADPRVVGESLLVTGVKKSPTRDVAFVISAVYRKPCCAVSFKHLGLSFSCVGPRLFIAHFAPTLAGEGEGVNLKIGMYTVSGFILTYPQSPKTGLPQIVEALEKTTVKSEYSPQLNSYLSMTEPGNSLSYAEFLEKRADMLKRRGRVYTSTRGRKYTLLTGKPSPFHVAVLLKEHVVAYEVYLPTPYDPAFAVPFNPTEVYLDDKRLNPPVEMLATGEYVVLLPKMRERLKESILRNGSAVFIARK